MSTTEKLYVIELGGCGLLGANVYLDRKEAEEKIEAFYKHSDADIVELCRTSDRDALLSENVALRERIAKLIAQWKDESTHALSASAGVGSVAFRSQLMCANALEAIFATPSEPEHGKGAGS